MGPEPTTGVTSSSRTHRAESPNADDGGIPGNQFNGEIASALAALIESDTIRVLDLVFIAKGRRR